MLTQNISLYNVSSYLKSKFIYLGRLSISASPASLARDLSRDLVSCQESGQSLTQSATSPPPPPDHHQTPSPTVESQTTVTVTMVTLECG